MQEWDPIGKIEDGVIVEQEINLGKLVVEQDTAEAIANVLQQSGKAYWE